MENNETPALSRYALAKAEARVWLDAHPKIEEKMQKNGWWPACLPMTRAFGMWVSYDIARERGIV